MSKSYATSNFIPQSIEEMVEHYNTYLDNCLKKWKFYSEEDRKDILVDYYIYFIRMNFLEKFDPSKTPKFKNYLYGGLYKHCLNIWKANKRNPLEMSVTITETREEDSLSPSYDTLKGFDPRLISEIENLNDLYSKLEEFLIKLPDDLFDIHKEVVYQNTPAQIFRWMQLEALTMIDMSNLLDTDIKNIRKYWKFINITLKHFIDHEVFPSEEVCRKILVK